jgi:hypothetical protein
MSTVAMTGNDTLILNDRVLADLADGDCAALTYPNELANLKTGKNGNTIYAFNQSGKQCELIIRAIRGSSDDKFLHNLLVQMKSNFAGFSLVQGEFIKQVGDGAGNITSDTYIVSGGIFAKQVEAKSNQEGDVAQSVSEYHVKFSNGDRTIT